ncbi:MAG TPA: hypothetical protein GX507_10345 [Clostridia bacterium]|nr:hypothetical protein [Clostridia bacterium]
MDGVSFHISCPVNLYSVARVVTVRERDSSTSRLVPPAQNPQEARVWPIPDLKPPKVTVVSPGHGGVPRDTWKTQLAAEKTIERLWVKGLLCDRNRNDHERNMQANVDSGMRRVTNQAELCQYSIHISITSEIPVGKGMASSTADIASSVYALLAAAGKQPIIIDPVFVAEIALSIEPTDGSLFPGIVLFDHREGKMLETLGEAPQIDIVILDFGGGVDTIEFNRHYRRDVLKKHEDTIRRALELATHGIKNHDLKALGEAATLSAKVNQEILYKPYLDHVIAFGSEVGALGVNVAHSGSVVGLLIDRRGTDATAVAGLVRKRFDARCSVIVTSLVGGGPSYLPGYEPGPVSSSGKRDSSHNKGLGAELQ